jgi:hypothetical protein
MVTRNEAEGKETSNRELAHVFKESTAILYRNKEGRVVRKAYYATGTEGGLATSIGNVREGTKQVLASPDDAATEGAPSETKKE